MKDIQTIAPIDRDEMVGLATTEYARLDALLQSLNATEWTEPTACSDWDVRLMIAHLLGAAESNASVRESLSQLFRGRRWAKVEGRPEIDGINAVQVDARSHLSPAELMSQLAAVAPKAIEGRRKTPGLVRRITISNPAGGRMTMGHLVDIVYTRDLWMHRLDINQAIGREPLLTIDHDARIVADVVTEWSELHGQPFELVLGGPAGGEYRSGVGGPHIEMDAVEFCLILSGRLDKEMPLYRPIVF